MCIYACVGVCVCAWYMYMYVYKYKCAYMYKHAAKKAKRNKDYQSMLFLGPVPERKSERVWQGLRPYWNMVHLAVHV